MTPVPLLSACWGSAPPSRSALTALAQRARTSFVANPQRTTRVPIAVREVMAMTSEPSTEVEGRTVPTSR